MNNNIDIEAIDYSKLNYNRLLSIIVSGCKFKYYSYDYKKPCLKDKYKVERISKIREIHFSPTGKAYRFKIGNKYPKTFGVNDFGVTVFPITTNEIYKSLIYRF